MWSTLSNLLILRYRGFPNQGLRGRCKSLYLPFNILNHINEEEASSSNIVETGNGRFVMLLSAAEADSAQSTGSLGSQRQHIEKIQDSGSCSLDMSSRLAAP